jgi:multidrug efflux pump subunit AcrA (membrane-fusion protein)
MPLFVFHSILLRARRFLAIGGAAALLICATGCSDKPALPSANAKEQKKTLREQIEDLRGTGGTVDVGVQKLTTATITADLSITGELVPRKCVIVKPLMDGRITFLRKIKVGDIVRENETIAKIDDRDIEDEIKQEERDIDITSETIRLDENELAQKEKDLEFDRGMVKDGFLNEIELRRSELELHRAEISLRQNRLRLEQAENKLTKALRQREKVPIKAPLEGMVVLASHLTGQSGSSDLLKEEITAIEGTLVGTGSELFGIVSQGDYLAQCMVNSKDKAKIRPGLKARLSVVSHKAIDAMGEVTQVAQLQDMKSHAYKVWIRIDNPDPSFTSGLFVRANIELDHRETALVLPRQYVKERDGRSFIQVVRDGKIQDVWVETGIRQGQDIEIMSGAAAGDPVVASNKVFLAGQSAKAVEVSKEE